MIDGRDVILRPKEKRIKFGHDGKWSKVVRNDKRRLVSPLAPLEKNVRRRLKRLRKGEIQPEA